MGPRRLVKHQCGMPDADAKLLYIEETGYLSINTNLSQAANNEVLRIDGY